MLIVGVALDVVVPVRGWLRLLVRVCVSVVPTIVPEGAVTAVNAEVPLPFTIPVNVDAPVPPSATARSVIPVIVPLVILALVVGVLVSSLADNRFMGLTHNYGFYGVRSWSNSECKCRYSRRGIYYIALDYSVIRSLSYLRNNFFCTKAVSKRY